MIRKLRPEFRKGKVMQACLLNRQSDYPVIEFITESAAPVGLVNALIASSINRADRLPIGIKPVDDGASRETEGHPVGTGHENRVVPAEVKILPAISRLQGELIEVNKIAGIDNFSRLSIVVFKEIDPKSAVTAEIMQG